MTGTIAILLALGAAAWVLLRAGKGGAQQRSMVRLKVVVLLALAAVLFAAKLFPLALMILIGAGGVTAIELWKERQIKAQDQMIPGAGTAPVIALKVEEAAALLGVGVDASEEEIKAAHKKLIGQLHPDKGGTDYLAAKINDARRVLLEHRDRATSV